MTTLAIACKTIEDEIMNAVRAEKSQFPIVWVESGLHLNPGKLREQLQREIDKVANVDNILLVFGYCGNSVLGLVSPRARLIIPQMDDCISLLLGGNCQRASLQGQGASYFLTRGWLRNEANIVKEFETCIGRYGKQRALKVFKIMLANYKNLSLIDTGAYPVESIMAETKSFAAELNLQHQVLPGTTEILRRAFRGAWGEGFVTVEPGQVVDYAALMITSGNNTPLPIASNC